MSLTSQKVDAIARILLSEDPATYTRAREELERLMIQSPGEQDSDVTVQIHRLLTEIGIPTCIIGHAYLVEAIRETVEDPQVLNGITLSGGLLDRIAKKYGAVSISAVDRGMRACILNAWNHGNHEFQSEHFTVLSPITFVPTVRNFISRAANIVRLRMEQQ